MTRFNYLSLIAISAISIAVSTPACGIEGQPTMGVTPPVDYLQKSRPTISLEGDFLWWTATMTGLNYAQKEEAIKPIVSDPSTQQLILVGKKTEELNWKWKPGFRLALGVNSNHDGWDGFVSWTYYYGKARSEHRAAPNQFPFQQLPPNPVGTETFTSSWFIENRIHQYNKITASNNLHINIVDLSQGRNFWISPKLSLRPFIGSRLFFSKTAFYVKGMQEGSPNVGASFASADAKQSIWSAGLLTGLNTEWKLIWGISLFGDFSFALTYGKNDLSLKRTLRLYDFAANLQESARGVIKETLYQLFPFADLGLGLRWSHLFDHTLRLSLDAAWESHVILEYNQLFKGTSHREDITSFPSQRGNLSMTGLVIRGKVEF
ncbi:MAG: hypothetical protein KDK71_08775 [Chlamydiia bacterium]|nr:hypothetical protein [Chlamydiia bacterium]